MKANPAAWRPVKERPWVVSGDLADTDSGCQLEWEEEEGIWREIYEGKIVEERKGAGGIEPQWKQKMELEWDGRKVGG